MRIRWALTGVLMVGVMLTGCTQSFRDPSGQVTSPATRGPFEIKAGDCLGSLTAGTANQVVLVPCSDPHYWQAYLITSMSPGPYPGQSRISEVGNQVCNSAFPGFVGVAPAKSKYQFTFLYPTQDTWENVDDRAITCVAGKETGGVVGSLKDIKK